MLNKEKYAKEIFEIACKGSSIAIAKNGELTLCIDTNCNNCIFKNRNCYTARAEWCNSEYKEKEIDWSKVPVDTKVIVEDMYGHHQRRYFAKYEDNKILYWCGGCTSYSADNDKYVRCCDISKVKIAEGVDCSEWYKD